VAKKETLEIPIGNNDPLANPLVCVTINPEQLSVAAGAAHVTIAPQEPALLFTLIFIGHEVNTGNSLSVTVTVKEHTLLLPLASVAVNVIVVVPMGNVDPLGNPAVCVITKPGQLSVAAGASHETTAEQFPGVLPTLMFAGHDVKIGACTSATVTVNEQSVEFPLASVAVYEIVVTPIGNEDPLGKPAVCDKIKPGQLSVAKGATHETVVLQKPGVVFTAIFAGQELNTGNWLSITVTVNEHVATNP
jgi:hypothetical protein